jgi:hypothetical protein
MHANRSYVYLQNANELVVAWHDRWGVCVVRVADSHHRQRDFDVPIHGRYELDRRTVFGVDSSVGVVVPLRKDHHHADHEVQQMLDAMISDFAWFEELLRVQREIAELSRARRYEVARQAGLDVEPRSSRQPKHRFVAEWSR